MMIHYSFLLFFLLSSSTTKDSQQEARFSVWDIGSFCYAQFAIDSSSASTLVTFDVEDNLITQCNELAYTATYPLWFKFKLGVDWKYLELLKSEQFEWAASILYEQAERFVFSMYQFIALSR